MTPRGFINDSHEAERLLRIAIRDGSCAYAYNEREHYEADLETLKRVTPMFGGYNVRVYGNIVNVPIVPEAKAIQVCTIAVFATLKP